MDSSSGKIIILAGREGTGKTYALLAIMNTILKQKPEQRCVLIDTEHKANLVKDLHFPDLAVDIEQCQQFKIDITEGKADLDELGTLNAIREAKVNAIKAAFSGKVAAIALDSIVGLRTPLCQHEWEMENKKKAFSPNSWMEINLKQREIIYPLMNIAKLTDVDVIITAEIGDRYEVIDKKTGVSVIVGEELKLKDWASFQAVYIFELRKDTKKGEYNIICTKSPRGMFSLSNRDIYNKSDVDYTSTEFKSLYLWMI